MSTNDDKSFDDNFHVKLKKRPGVNNEPSIDNFGHEKVPYPSIKSMQDGELLIKNLYISVDPALRCFMNEITGVAYAEPWKIGETIQGLGGVGEVIVSKSPGFKEGNRVVAKGFWPWKKYFVITADQVYPVPEAASSLPQSLFLSAFGLTSLTAYLGVTTTGHIRKDHDQTMVISAAAGSTGSLAGQIARAEGCQRVVGICGTDEKCQWVTKDLGFGAAINYKTENVSDRLKETCPKGIDIYFDNVGGSISDDVIRNMNKDSNIILCGQISKYNTDAPYPPPLSEEIAAVLAEKNISRERFLVLSHQDQFEASIQKLIGMYMSGTFKVKETIEKGLCNAGKAFVSMMEGGNIGKQLVQVTE